MLGRPAAGSRSGEGDGRVVIDRLGVQRLDDGDVDHDRGVRQQFAHPRPACPCCENAKIEGADAA